MAPGSSGIPIPPIHETDRIEDWELISRASVGYIIANGEAGVKTTVSMIPAFVCRRLVEIEVSKEALKCDSLDSAFKLLKEQLDLPWTNMKQLKDSMPSMAAGRASGRLPGALHKQAKRTRYPIRTTCVTMTAQLPKEVQGKAKSWIADN
ncbi:hypothetical protein LOD99_3685 [Oopsacas minuta]|uniref:Uncharacterized protein n=1 Tax=Oopsacas minuta TaxID=111878 RepID=A0AAV7JX14_9METZ|nr:hypothetical protein LOD99_3685 [Oopsacas minuta]